jgi:hypothetical protein
MTFHIVTDSPRGNLAVNRATCEHFISQSRSGNHWPCFRCPFAKPLRDVNSLALMYVCPHGVGYFSPYDPDNDNLHFRFDVPKVVPL